MYLPNAKMLIFFGFDLKLAKNKVKRAKLYTSKRILNGSHFGTSSLTMLGHYLRFPFP